MKQLNEKMLKEIKEFYELYKNLMREKKELSSHNKDLKNDFIAYHFGDESKFEPTKRNLIKKEVTKYFRCLDETGSGSDPVIEVRELRKTHLDFEDVIYDKLMHIFNQIEDNIIKKEEADDNLEKLYRNFAVCLEINDDIAKGILDLWYKEEIGKFPINVEVVECYKRIVAELNKE